MSTRADRDTVTALGPDVVIIATGGLLQVAGGVGEAGFEVYKVGDGVSSRGIHCAILDSPRLCRAL